MFPKAIASVLFLLSSNVLAYQFPVEIIEKFDDARVVIFLQENDINNSPAWIPANGAPPLSIEKVVSRVQEWCTKDKQLKNASIRKIELKPVLRHEQKDRWYYLVQLRTPAIQNHRHQYLTVLMNGRILSAIREPSSYK